VEFVIAGPEVPQCEFENVRCLGFVEDLYALLKRADIAVVPLKRGGGTRLKILDYFAAGLPVVTTRKGIEGIEAQDKVHALIVDDTEDLIGALRYLIGHPEERERISTNALELVKNQYDWDIIGEALNQRYVEFIA
ncbi:MAG: glycosyltransferase, partial [Halobacteriota archaeon]